MLSASACTTNPSVTQRPPLDVGADAGPVPCSGVCPAFPPWKTGDFDELIGLGAANQQVLEQCEAKLKACQAALKRARDAGVIR